MAAPTRTSTRAASRRGRRASGPCARPVAWRKGTSGNNSGSTKPLMQYSRSIQNKFEDPMDRVAFPYRSSSHLVLLHVVAESGAWEKHGLDVDYDRHISSGDAHRAVPAGEVEFVGGNHVSTYGHRARGDSWVYLGQTVNQVNHQ